MGGGYAYGVAGCGSYCFYFGAILVVLSGSCRHFGLLPLHWFYWIRISGSTDNMY